MAGSYTYLLIDLGAWLFPLLLSFDKKVAFYRHWPAVFRAIALTALPFLVWDYFKTDAGVWAFAPDKVCGIYIGNLPLEECLFFIIVPYNVLFIAACLEAYFGERLQQAGKRFALTVPVAALLLMVLHYDKAYTLAVSAAVCIYTVFYIRILKGERLGMLLVTYLVHLLPFFLMNGLLTAIPVVLYNEKEYMGYRFGTVPAEDTLYSYAMLLSYLGWYYYFRGRSGKTR